MCGWHWAVYADESWDEEVLSVPFAGGRGLNEEAMERAYRRLARPLAGWLQTHPERRETVRAVVMSCNGPQLTRFPFTETPDRVEEGW